MNIAIVGAAGSCGRQLAAQLLDRRLLPASARLQLVGHRSGRSADELWGLRADLEDAFVDDAPTIEVVLEPSTIDADLVVMLAGATISTDPNAPVDRAALGRTNRQMFVEYADALGGRPGLPPASLFNPTRWSSVYRCLRSGWAGSACWVQRPGRTPCACEPK
jgi:malate dehydrogenase